MISIKSNLWQTTDPPKDRKFDAFVKRWDSSSDKFYYYRIPNVKWSSGCPSDGVMPGYKQVWPSVGKDLRSIYLSDLHVHIVAWMDIPELPQCDDAKVYI